MDDTQFAHWCDALERRHLSNLTFPEVRRAVQALSSLYVERRSRLQTASPFSGAGKRAAFAMYFGPLHFLLVREIVRALNARIPEGASILDLGCGTGVAGAAWAGELAPKPRVAGIDRNAWALEEARWTYREFGIDGIAKNGNAGSMRIPSETAVIAAFTINEIDASSRERLHGDFLRRAGAPVLVIEPIARRLASWWDDWAKSWISHGGRADEWRFRVELPERLALMDRAAGLDHRELTGRSLWLPAGA
jgi:hypothetical protein